MPIPVIQEPIDLGPPYEHCCFCGGDTKYWTNIKGRSDGCQVACCRTCAEKHRINEVPSKEQWMDEEGDKTRNQRPRYPIPRSQTVYRSPEPMPNNFKASIGDRTKAKNGRQKSKQTNGRGRSNGTRTRSRSAHN